MTGQTAAGIGARQMVVTSVCVNQDESDRGVIYPYTRYASAQRRRRLYWMCAAVLAASVRRCEPEARMLVYTNDTAPIRFGACDIGELLGRLGVRIVQLPFEKFRPPRELCSRFRNAYYKLDVLCSLAATAHDAAIVLLDSDCIWIKSDPGLFTAAKGESVLLHDPYEWEFATVKYPPHNLSKVGIGEVCRTIEPGYPEPCPIWYGSEFIAGSSGVFRLIADAIRDGYGKVLEASKQSPLVLENGQNFFCGDEFFLTYLLNKRLVPIVKAKRYIKRMQTEPEIRNTSEKDFGLAIWHLPAEKMRAFPLLFREAVNLQSQFWTIGVEAFPRYIGSFVGIPKRTRDSFPSRIKEMLRYRAKALLGR